MITSLIKATLSLSAARETAQRQMEAEERKRSAKVHRSPLSLAACMRSAVQAWPVMQQSGLCRHRQAWLASNAAD